jgi:hypothetical protein
LRESGFFLLIGRGEKMGAPRLSADFVDLGANFPGQFQHPRPIKKKAAHLSGESGLFF